MSAEKKEIAPKINDHLANDRTLLAWVRTSIGIMTFGFVVFRFSLFIKQLSTLVGKEVEVPYNETTSYIGIVLVIAGTMTLLVALWSYKETEKQIETGKYTHSSSLLVFLVTFIVLVSVLLILYLLSSI